MISAKSLILSAALTLTAGAASALTCGKYRRGL